MTGFNHVLSGVAIAVTVKQPLFAPILALISHFVLDASPHFWHDRLEVWAKPLIAMIIIDLTLSFTFLTLGYFLFPEHAILITVCAILATIPDWFWLLRYRFKLEHSFFHFHQDIQRFERPWGIYIEVPFMIIMLCIIWYISR